VKAFEYFLFVCSYIIISNSSVVIIVIIVVVVVIVMPIMQIYAFVAVNLSFKRVFRLFSWTTRPLKMGPIGSPETSVGSYHSTLRNSPEECSSHLHSGGSLKSCM
jgi:hypothetical protein